METLKILCFVLQLMMKISCQLLFCDFCVSSLPGKAVRTVTSTNTSANISADTSSVMSPEKETVRWTKHLSGQTASRRISVAHSPFKVSSFSPVKRTQQGSEGCLWSTTVMELIFFMAAIVAWWSASDGRRWEEEWKGAGGGGGGRGSVNLHWHLPPFSSPF